MQEFIARENIKRFEDQLENCRDEEQRRVIVRLLDDERARLADIMEHKLPDVPPTGAAST